MTKIHNPNPKFLLCPKNNSSRLEGNGAKNLKLTDQIDGLVSTRNQKNHTTAH